MFEQSATPLPFIFEGQSFVDVDPIVNDATFHNWTITSKGDYLDTNYTRIIFFMVNSVNV